MEKKIRAHIFIEGRVQGVFYRSWAKGQAEEFGLVGWAKNLADGRVEMVVEGSREKVEKMIEECKLGSRFASPAHIDVNIEEPTGDFETFEIVS